MPANQDISHLVVCVEGARIELLQSSMAMNCGLQDVAELLKLVLVCPPVTCQLREGQAMVTPGKAGLLSLGFHADGLLSLRSFVASQELRLDAIGPRPRLERCTVLEAFLRSVFI